MKSLFILALCVLVIGCKAGPAKNAGFVDPAMMTHDKTLPFQKVWKKPGFEFANYKKIYISPVDTTHMLKSNDWEKGERKDQFVSDIATLARYTRNAVQKSFREDPKHHFEVLEEPTKSDDALVFNMSLIEVVPSKVVLNALG